MKKKVLILGGEGFIGRNIVDYLSDNFECFSVGIEKSVFNERKDKFIEIDVYKEKIENDYDVIIHLIDNKIESDKFSVEEEKLIKNIGLDKKNHLIVFSSAVVYANPNSDYGKRKIMLENLYKSYCEKNGIKLTIFRLFNTFGYYQFPYRQGSLIANILVNNIKKTTTLINDINATRDFIFAADIGKILEYAILNEKTGKFDLSSNQLVSIRKIIEISKKVAESEISIEDQKEKEIIISPVGKCPFLDHIILTPLEDAIYKTYHFYQNNLNILI